MCVTVTLFPCPACDSTYTDSIPASRTFFSLQEVLSDPTLNRWNLTQGLYSDAFLGYDLHRQAESVRIAPTHIPIQTKRHPPSRHRSRAATASRRTPGSVYPQPMCYATSIDLSSAFMQPVYHTRFFILNIGPSPRPREPQGQTHSAGRMSFRPQPIQSQPRRERSQI
jgi:hypothetical protein